MASPKIAPTTTTSGKLVLSLLCLITFCSDFGKYEECAFWSIGTFVSATAFVLDTAQYRS